MNIKMLLSVCLIAAGSQSHAMEDDTRLNVYAIPGQNGCGSAEDYVKNLLGEDHVNVASVSTPHILPDLGQGFCLQNLRTAIEDDPFRHAIIHATSQGTATAINYVAHEDKGRRIKALILESVIGSGNSAIEHTVGGPLMLMDHITRLPFSYYWLPYIAQISQMQAYLPFGKQPIKSLSKIPNNLPVIIAHSQEDMQLSYRDACALYCGLRLQGNDNAYLITKPDSRHIHILQGEADREIVQNILKKHKLMPGELDATKLDLSVIQPDPMQYKKLYEDLLAKEKRHEWIAGSACAAAVATVASYCAMGSSGDRQ
jgi:hypothetical protein